MIHVLFRKLTLGAASLCLAGLVAWSSLSIAQNGDEGPSLEKQLESVHAYVARTREWSRDDYVVKPLRADSQGAFYPSLAFRVNLTSDRVRAVLFDEQFDVFLSSRSGEVVGENAQNPHAIRDER